MGQKLLNRKILECNNARMNERECCVGRKGKEVIGLREAGKKTRCKSWFETSEKEHLIGERLKCANHGPLWAAITIMVHLEQEQHRGQVVSGARSPLARYTTALY